MRPWLIIILILVILALAITFRAVYELHTLKVSNYKIETNKLPENEHKRIIFISDLHNRSYGDNNENLIKVIKDNNPDYIFIGGDMVVASKKNDDCNIINLLKKLSEIAAVYYAFGNHEKYLEIHQETYGKRFSKLIETINNNNIKLLQNQSFNITDDIVLTGLDIDFKYYKKIKTPKYNLDNIQNDLGNIDKSKFNILLAHSPRYFDLYEQIGVDLALSGHYHGGAIGLGKNGGVISPQFRFFPKYCRGMFTKNNIKMIVTSGCGSHKVNLRLNNKPEVMVIDLYGHFIQN